MCPSAVKFIQKHNKMDHDIKDLEDITKLSDEVFKIEAAVEKSGKVTDQQISKAQSLTDRVYKIVTDKLGHKKSEAGYMDDHMTVIKNPKRAGEMKIQEGRRGLWANIHAKRKRIERGSGERMRKPGSKGAPTPAQLKRSQEETLLSFADFIAEDDMKGMSVGSGHKRSVKQGAGMTKKGVAAYRRRNPGSKLGTAVTTPPSKLKAGSKAAGRRKSFCARSRSWTGPRGKAARRRWNC